MNQFIVDTSIAAKWFFVEEMTDKALQFLRKIEDEEIRGIVPDFFYSELANVLWVKAKRKMTNISRAVESLDRVMSLPLQHYCDRELSDVALENSFQYGISPYDGIYIALAEIYLSPLVTADEKLLKACGKRFEFIESLKDFSLE